jgi:flap endonuclease-1
MGVDLSGILEKHPSSLQAYSGRRVAIDAYNTIYQFLTIIRQPDGTPLQDSRGRITSHLSGLFYRTCNMLEAQVKPTYVFDGPPSPLKKATLEARAEIKRQALEKMQEALKEGRVQEAAMLAQRTAKLTPQIADEAKGLLDLMGVPWVQAPSEGEAQCAVMAANGLVHAAASQDYDSLMFGAPLLVRNLTVSGRKKIARRQMFVEVVPEEFRLQENLEINRIDRQKLVWIGLLAGTDFNKGVYGIGAKKGLKLVQESKSLKEIEGKLGEKAQGMDLQPVLELFLNPPYKQVEKSDLEFKPLQRDKLVSLMCDEHEFSQDRVNSSLAKAYSQPLDSNQSQLEKWF